MNAQPRDHLITLRLNDRELRSFRRGAAASGMDLSAYLRALVSADLSVSGRPLSLSARLASLELAVREQAAALAPRKSGKVRKSPRRAR